MRYLLSVAAVAALSSTASAKNIAVLPPAECFCTGWRDLNAGHFEPDGDGFVFVVDEALSPGPGNVLRATGDHVSVVVAGPVAEGRHLLMDLDGRLCALPISAEGEVGDVRLDAMECTAAEVRPGCMTSVAIDDIATLRPDYDADTCGANIAALDIRSRTDDDDGCAGAGPAPLVLAFAALALRRTRSSRARPSA